MRLAFLVLVTSVETHRTRLDGIALAAEIITSDVCLLGQTSQLSRRGLSTQTNRPLTPGTTCEVRVSLVFSAQDRSEALPLRASVAWCTCVHDSFQVGLRFTNPDKRETEYLELFIGIVNDGELAGLFRSSTTTS